MGWVRQATLLQSISGLAAPVSYQPHEVATSRQGKGVPDWQVLKQDPAREEGKVGRAGGVRPRTLPPSDERVRLALCESRCPQQ
jgi:hypothetical protein